MADLGKNICNNHKNVKDLAGQKFGRLTVLQRYGSDKNRHATWLCRCECGKERIVASSTLIEGKTLSCGCYARDINRKRMSTHSKSKTRLYRIWMGMKNRCYNPNDPAYRYYGSRGISICDSWIENFQNFYNWSMNNDYMDYLTIDRIDVDSNYSPDNCRWIPLEQQSKNRTNVILYNGFNQREWAFKLGVPDSYLVRYRKKNNCDLDKAVRFFLVKNFL